MNKIRPILLALAVVFSALLAYGFLTLPKAQPSDAEGFSADRVVEDIKVIAQEPHSVANPEERAKVRGYLVERLEELGGKVTLYQYDSLVGPQNKHVSYTFDAVNVLAEFPPLEQSDKASYLMFVAHYDSRYSTILPEGEVWSYGAADDGYGLGIILETVSQLLDSRQDWKQGVKVLFTDAEEVGMMGMKSAWDKDREIFDNVGFLINIEARGPWGPALLFETGAGNEKVMKLYASEAKYKYTYSLTNVVYSMMPNFTDFTVVMKDIPGMNFSTVADVNRYHTDEDNIGNVSAKSIQHYGEQILPVSLKYLTDPIYSDKDALKSDKDSTNFTIPGLGIINVSKVLYKILNVTIFVLFLLLFMLEGLRGRLKAASVFKNSCMILCISVGVLAAGELIAYICSAIAGAKFKLFGTVQGIPFDNIAMIASVVITAVASAVVYLSFRNNAVRNSTRSMRTRAASNAASRYVYNSLYGTLALLFILSFVLVFLLGENMMFVITLAMAAVAMILWHITSLKFWLLAAIFVILLHAFSFLYALAMALTIGALGAVLMIAFLDIMVLIPMMDLYLMSEK